MGIRVIAFVAIAGLLTVGGSLLQLGYFAPGPDLAEDSVPVRTTAYVADVNGAAESDFSRPRPGSSTTSDDEDVPVAAAGDSAVVARADTDVLPPLFDEPSYCRSTTAQGVVEAYAYASSLTDEQRSSCRAYRVLRVATEKGLELSDLPPEDRILLEERDPVWARDTENALVNLVARLEGVTLSSLKTECKSTVCTADLVVEPFANSQGEGVRLVHPQIARLSKEIGLRGELTLGAMRDNNWWFQAAFTRIDESAANEQSD